MSMEFSFDTFALSMCKKKPYQSSNDSNWNPYCDIYLNFQLQKSIRVNKENANGCSKKKYQQA